MTVRDHGGRPVVTVERMSLVPFTHHHETVPISPDDVIRLYVSPVHVTESDPCLQTEVRHQFLQSKPGEHLFQVFNLAKLNFLNVNDDNKIIGLIYNT